MISEAEQIEQQWKAAIALLLTIPGIGPLTACWLVIATLNFSTYETAEAAIHYIAFAIVKSEQIFDANYQATTKREAALA